MKLREALDKVICSEFKKFTDDANNRPIVVSNDVDYYPYSSGFLTCDYSIKSTMIQVGENTYVGGNFADAACLALSHENADKRLERSTKV